MVGKGINKVILIGNLGQDPDVRYTSNGNAVTNISIATSESWKNKRTNEVKEKTEWHRVVLFGKLAEISGEYLRKGSQVYIEGVLQTRKWKDNNGYDRYITEIVVNNNGVMRMLGYPKIGVGVNNRRYNNSDNINDSGNFDIDNSNDVNFCMNNKSDGFINNNFSVNDNSFSNNSDSIYNKLNGNNVNVNNLDDSGNGIVSGIESDCENNEIINKKNNVNDLEENILNKFDDHYDNDINLIDN